MTSAKTSPTYDQLLQWAQEFTAANEAQDVDGEYYGQPGKTVFTTTKVKLETGGRLEANLTTESGSEFSWRAEITIDDAENEYYKHVLLQEYGEIVETYGKNIIPVDEPAAQGILSTLQRLSN